MNWPTSRQNLSPISNRDLEMMPQFICLPRTQVDFCLSDYEEFGTFFIASSPRVSTTISCELSPRHSPSANHPTQSRDDMALQRLQGYNHWPCRPPSQPLAGQFALQALRTKL